MDALDVFTPTQKTDLFEFETTDPIKNNLIDDSSWFLEDNPPVSFQSDDITSSQTPTLSTDDLLDTHDESNIIPSTVEDISSANSTNGPSDERSPFDLFAKEEFSPLTAINKRREEEIAAKDAEENRRIEILRQQAKTDLENWHHERQRQLEQTLQTIRNEDDLYRKFSSEKSSKEFCDWSKVIRLLDLTDGRQLTTSKRDLTRMKECMLNAKRFNEKKKLANGN